ncbi:MAG: Hpt domain-containing protein [Pirellulaceae bacterium]|nr:Hpt domain-containing protein [Pirellulaceae bacterium]
MIKSPKIFSEMASDPDFAELLEEFVSKIPERIRTIHERMEAQDRTTLCTLVHQLRGACGSYGFHEMTPLASALELALRSDKQLSELSIQVQDFLDACSRLTADPN